MLETSFGMASTFGVSKFFSTSTCILEDPMGDDQEMLGVSSGDDDDGGGAPVGAIVGGVVGGVVLVVVLVVLAVVLYRRTRPGGPSSTSSSGAGQYFLGSSVSGYSLGSSFSGTSTPEPDYEVNSCW